MERTELEQLLTCPLNWSTVCDEIELVHWLQFAWYAIAHRYQVDGEVQVLVSYDDFAPSVPELDLLDEHSDLRSELLNVRTWHAKAKEEYLMHYQNLHRQRALRRDEYPKHYPNLTWTLKQVVAESKKRGDAVLLPAVDETTQGKLLWAALDEIVYHQVKCNQLEAHGEPGAPAAALAGLFGRDTLILAADINRIVGASGGRETPYLLFNLSMPNALFHTYPISAEEYQREEFHAHVQGWNYGLQDQTHAAR
jgi:hypothetical protein